MVQRQTTKTQMTAVSSRLAHPHRAIQRNLRGAATMPHRAALQAITPLVVDHECVGLAALNTKLFRQRNHSHYTRRALLHIWRRLLRPASGSVRPVHSTHSTELRPSFTFIFMMPFLKDRASLCLATPSCGCPPACAQGWWCGSIYCMRRCARRGSSCHFRRRWRRAQRSALLFMILRSRHLTARFCSQRQTC